MITIIFWTVTNIVVLCLGIRIGRRQVIYGKEMEFLGLLGRCKQIADDNLRQFAAHTTLHMHVGDRVVECKSTTETAQFSEAARDLLEWFKPVDQVHPPKSTL
jgi:hypothetical protein